MTAFYEDLICYKQLQITHDGKLKFFLEKHSTKEGTWGKLQINTGEIDFLFLDGNGQELSRHHLNEKNNHLVIPPASWHKIIPISAVFNASLDFYCKPHRYFDKKYKLGNVHTDLYYVYTTYLQKKDKLKVLDIGCGSGRNPLFLALMGHEVTGIDHNEAAIKKMRQIVHEEEITTLTPIVHDLHTPLSLKREAYNLVIATVSLQFLDAARIPSLLKELQEATVAQGIHFFVFPIRSEQFELPTFFTYLAEHEELYHYYQNCGWSILEYKEVVGKLHKLDESGKPIQGLFGILLAQKCF
ncbi:MULTISPECIES: SAM-dependent methyltransferase TehB [Legionella]|uniref:SAM-dependent methyltransferase TehB n=1 Tax=Legionella resiliens TaxID=2905958 RepID=A0ABS8WZZ5_9GAMM|nr:MULTISPECIES: SAM-dependent methyltransferase TehB [unclassified Legionella]MCE0722913.1 SAM-dependent methyltransferase TehB [Legionella sp. 9fVS26]MCE3532066.1 SAM-dependent methyltransferase TehB [Legionella sp. 8cVS16]QLZ68192.1 SAM-dependent methyltransferase TehB [Legionella sp. PC1000]